MPAQTMSYEQALQALRDYVPDVHARVLLSKAESRGTCTRARQGGAIVVDYQKKDRYKVQLP